MKLDNTTTITGLFHFSDNQIYTAGDILLYNGKLYSVLKDYSKSVTGLYPDEIISSDPSYCELYSHSSEFDFINTTSDSIVTTRNLESILLNKCVSFGLSDSNDLSTKISNINKLYNSIMSDIQPVIDMYNSISNRLFTFKDLSNDYVITENMSSDRSMYTLMDRLKFTSSISDDVILNFIYTYEFGSDINGVKEYIQLPIELYVKDWNNPKLVRKIINISGVKDSMDILLKPGTPNEIFIYKNSTRIQLEKLYTSDKYVN